jgi:hypothetical protein
MRANRPLFLALAILVAIAAAACASLADTPTGQAKEPTAIPVASPTTLSRGEPTGVAISATSPGPVGTRATDTPATESGKQPAPAGDMPSSKGYLDTSVPAQSARIDLAARLHTDADLVEILDVTSQKPDPQTMPCLADGSLAEELWSRAETVEWISLSIKGNLYHYLALGDLLLYCEE